MTVYHNQPDLQRLVARERSEQLRRLAGRTRRRRDDDRRTIDRP